MTMIIMTLMWYSFTAASMAASAAAALAAAAAAATTAAEKSTSSPTTRHLIYQIIAPNCAFLENPFNTVRTVP